MAKMETIFIILHGFPVFFLLFFLCSLELNYFNIYLFLTSFACQAAME